MNRASVVSDLAKVLQISEAEAERILRAFTQVLGPVTAEVPPYFERYFEAQIQLILQKIADLERSTQHQIDELRQSTQQQVDSLRHYFEQGFKGLEGRIDLLERRIDLLEKRIDRLGKWLLSVLVMILSGILAIIFRIYFGG